MLVSPIMNNKDLKKKSVFYKLVSKPFLAALRVEKKKEKKNFFGKHECICDIVRESSELERAEPF